MSGLPDPYGTLLANAGWGSSAETGLHSLRLDRGRRLGSIPALQIIIGHMGEDLPFSLARADSWLSPVPGRLTRSVADYFGAHFHVTTSGYFTVPPFLCALMVVGADRLMFSVDYPFSPNATGRAFLNSMPIVPADREKMAGTTRHGCSSCSDRRFRRIDAGPSHHQHLASRGPVPGARHPK